MPKLKQLPKLSSMEISILSALQTKHGVLELFLSGDIPEIKNMTELYAPLAHLVETKFLKEKSLTGLFLTKQGKEAIHDYSS